MALTFLALIFFTGAGAKAAASVVTVKDDSGRTVVVQKPFGRIISLYGAHTENLFSLGVGQNIIGVSQNSNYPPPVKGKPVFSYHDGAEKFLAAGPDLVLIRPMIDRGYPRLVQRLEQSGIVVVSLQPGTIDEMYRYWETLGVLTGRRPAARKMVARFKRATAAFRELTAGIENKKRVYFEAIHTKMKTFTPQAMAIFALECAGGINVAADAKQVRTTNIAFYGKERILAKGDQIDVYLAQKGAMNQPSVALIQSEPGYQAIKAVRDKQIFIIDEKRVSRPTLRLLQGINEIGGKLYPQIFGPQGPKILAEVSF